MFVKIAYYLIWGKPLLIWAGLLGFVFILLAALTAFLILKGYLKISIKYHKILAAIGLFFVLIHGTLAIIINF